jgi:hypothetical protein
VNGRTLLWTLVAFFGASIVFNRIVAETEGEPWWVTLGLNAVALAAIVTLIVVLVRRQG